MDIFNPIERKLRCVRNDSNAWGNPHNNHLLEVGRIYTLYDLCVHSSYTDVYLEELPGVNFSSVMFEEIDEDGD